MAIERTLTTTTNKRLIAVVGILAGGCIISFYNIYLMLLIAGRPGWRLILYFIPLVNIVIGIIVAIDVAKTSARESASAWA